MSKFLSLYARSVTCMTVFLCFVYVFQYTLLIQVGVRTNFRGCKTRYKNIGDKISISTPVSKGRKVAFGTRQTTTHKSSLCYTLLFLFTPTEIDHCMWSASIQKLLSWKESQGYKNTNVKCFNFLVQCNWWFLILYPYIIRA